MIGDVDDTTICNVLLGDGTNCGREFPDEISWQEHFEDEHLDEEENLR